MSAFVSRASEQLAALQTQLERRSQGFDEEVDVVAASDQLSPPPSPRAATPEAVHVQQDASQKTSPDATFKRTVTFYEPAGPESRKEGKSGKLGTFEGVFQPVCLNVRLSYFSREISSYFVFFASCESSRHLERPLCLTDKPRQSTRIGIVSLSCPVCSGKTSKYCSFRSYFCALASFSAKPDC
jgi:hypothetical protein